VTRAGPDPSVPVTQEIPVTPAGEIAAPGSPAARRAAAALRRAGDTVTGRRLSGPQLERLAGVVEAWCDDVATAAPWDKREVLLAQGGMAEYMLTGMPQPAPPDGSELIFDEVSFVGGASSGVSMGFRYRRDGDEAVAETVFGPAFEGPPGRVHGGAVAGAMDEVLSLMLLFIGQPAYTVNLVVRFRSAAPLGEPVVFRSRLVGRDGRKLSVAAEGSSAEGVFAEAEALFVLAPPPDGIGV
jgi:acyl-coenzyme A thioesterase PaaI-like protein